MRTLALRALRDYWVRHSDAEGELKAWFKTVERASWGSFAEMKADLPSADMKGRVAVFNICGNRHRLVCLVNFQSKHVLVKWIGTHAEYDKIRIEDFS